MIEGEQPRDTLIEPENTQQRTKRYIDKRISEKDLEIQDIKSQISTLAAKVK